MYSYRKWRESKKLTVLLYWEDSLICPLNLIHSLWMLPKCCGALLHVTSNTTNYILYLQQNFNKISQSRIIKVVKPSSCLDLSPSMLPKSVQCQYVTAAALCCQQLHRLPTSQTTAICDLRHNGNHQFNIYCNTGSSKIKIAQCYQSHCPDLNINKLALRVNTFWCWESRSATCTHSHHSIWLYYLHPALSLPPQSHLMYFTVYKRKLGPSPSNSVALELQRNTVFLKHLGCQNYEHHF